MAVIGPNTHFKNTSSKMRRILRALGFNAIQVYERLKSFKLRKHLYTMTVSALSTATTAGSQYSVPSGAIVTLQESCAVGATVIRVVSDVRLQIDVGQPDAVPLTLTYVANSSGTLGTHQASITCSSMLTAPPADLGPVQKHQ